MDSLWCVLPQCLSTLGPSGKQTDGTPSHPRLVRHEAPVFVEIKSFTSRKPLSDDDISCAAFELVWTYRGDFAAQPCPAVNDTGLE